MTKSKLAVLTYAMNLGLVSCAYGDISVHSFPPSVFDTDTAAMDATLGIKGFKIENFEDLQLVSGLSVEFFRSGAAGFQKTIGELSNLYGSPSVWDGSNVLINQPENVFQGRDFDSTRITFHFSPPALSVGVGLIGFRSSSILVHLNGSPLAEPLGTLASPNFETSTRFRSAFLRFDATEGMSISSIGFDNIPSGLLSVDHLAIQYLPEPTTLALLCLATCLIGSRQFHLMNRA